MDTPGTLNLDCYAEIFKRVKDPSDLKSLSDTCPEFEELLRPSKPNWKSALVLPLLFNYLNHQEEFEDYDDEDEEETRKPYWGPMLRCRLVCKTWRYSIDKHLETFHQPEDYPQYRHPTSCYFDDRNEHVGPRMEEFLQRFQNHRGNPFIGRCINLVHFHRHYTLDGERGDYSEEDRERHSQHYAKVIQFLVKFGEHIWTLEFEERESYQHLSFCKHIQLLLTHLPKLRNLKFRHCSFHRCITDYESLEDSDKLEGIDELSPYLEENPLPDLPYLESLNAAGICFKMGQALIQKYAPNLKFLLMRDPRPFTQFVSSFSCLRVLELWVDAGNTLEGLRQLRSPLEKLTVQERWNKDCLPLWAVDNFLRNIMHLPVKDLSLHCECFIGESIPITDSLQLPSVSKIQIVRGSRQMSMSFNFMLCFPNLKKMELYLNSSPELTAPHPNGIPDKMLVTEFLLNGNLYSSNIWERIPSLDAICGAFWRRVGCRGRYHKNSYTRSGYDRWLIEQAEENNANH